MISCHTCVKFARSYLKILLPSVHYHRSHSRPHILQGSREWIRLLPPLASQTLLCYYGRFLRGGGSSLRSTTGTDEGVVLAVVELWLAFSSAILLASWRIGGLIFKVSPFRLRDPEICGYRILLESVRSIFFLTGRVLGDEIRFLLKRL